MKLRTVACLMSLTIVAFQFPVSAEPEPESEPLQVNTTTGGMGFSDAAWLPSGEFVVVWDDYFGQYIEMSTVLAQRFSANGQPLDDEFQPTAMEPFERRPAVAATGDGFVVVWHSILFEEGLGYIWAQLYGSDGAKVGAEFIVNNEEVDASGAYPDVTSRGDGSFLVVWDQLSGITAQRFASNGTEVGNEFQVEPTGTEDPARPSVSMNAEGSFVVVWEADDAGYNDLTARRFSSAGSTIGAEIVIDPGTTATSRRPKVSMSSEGDFVIAWGSDGALDGEVGFASFRSDGSMAGDLILPSGTEAPTVGVALERGGHFVLVWDNTEVSSPDGSGSAVLVREFSLDGTALGGEMVANTYTTGRQDLPSVGMDAEGRFVVSWREERNAGSYYDIVARLYTSPSHIFSDGFESAGLTAWSAVVE